MPENQKTDWDHIRLVNGVIDLRWFGAVSEEDLEPEPSRRAHPTGEGESSTQSPRRACGSEDN